MNTENKQPAAPTTGTPRTDAAVMCSTEESVYARYQRLQCCSLSLECELTAAHAQIDGLKAECERLEESRARWEGDAKRYATNSDYWKSEWNNQTADRDRLKARVEELDMRLTATTVDLEYQKELVLAGRKLVAEVNQIQNANFRQATKIQEITGYRNKFAANLCDLLGINKLDDEAPSILDTLKARLAELAALREDKERLDWITRYWDSQCVGLQPLSDTKLYPNPDGSFRAAIDAARASATEGGK